jgi:hypothetical protein
MCAKEGGQVAHPQKNDKGVSRASKKLGISKKGIRRGLKVSKVVPEAAKVLKEAGLDKDQLLLKVAEASPEEQVAVAQEIVEKRKQKKRTQKKAQPAKAEHPEGSQDGVNEDDWEDTPFDALKTAWDESPNLRKAWSDANAGDRQRFIDEVLLADEFAGDDSDGDDDWDEGSGTSIDAAAA